VKKPTSYQLKSEISNVEFGGPQSHPGPHISHPSHNSQIGLKKNQMTTLDKNPKSCSNTPNTISGT
jgi:hypothetical protein